MANDDDTSLPQPRGPPPGASAPPDHVAKPQVYEIFNPSRPENGDGKFSPAGPGQPSQQGQQARPSMTEGLKSIKSDDWLKVHQLPCARQGFLTGIGSGFVVGFIRYLTGARVPKAANWAAGSFVLGSIAQWEVCRYQREQERVAMARVVEVIDRKQAEKKQRAEEAARRRAEAQEKAREAAKKSWYKFW